MKKIAVILTCHNRREKTLKCLESLFASTSDCDVYLTDDGCTDGTPESVLVRWPDVHIVKGNGNLFWSRGMFTAWKESVKGNYEYYLWLNDDIELYPDFIEELFHSYDMVGGDCIITGLIGNIADKNKVLYGGSNQAKHLLQATGKPQHVTYMNGNVVLVPKSVVDRIGIIDPVLHHDLGDVDYGLTANEHGIKVMTTTKIIALGYSNDFCRVRKWGTTMRKRFKKLSAPLGSPIKINFYFRLKHFGIINALVYCIFLVMINLMPDKMVEALWGDRYKDK